MLPPTDGDGLHLPNSAFPATFLLLPPVAPPKLGDSEGVDVMNLKTIAKVNVQHVQVVEDEREQEVEHEAEDEESVGYTLVGCLWPDEWLQPKAPRERRGTRRLTRKLNGASELRNDMEVYGRRHRHIAKKWNMMKTENVGRREGVDLLSA